MSGSDPPESHRGNGTPATRSIRVCLGTMIRRIADCLLERLPRLCSVHDDPVSVHDDPVYGISINVQVLYRGYASRARKLRRYALWCLVLTFVTYLYIFGGSVLITLEYQERAKKDIDQSLERANANRGFSICSQRCCTQQSQNRGRRCRRGGWRGFGLRRQRQELGGS